MGKRGPKVGTISPMRGRGRAVAWLRANANHDGDACLIFPMARNPQTGYAIFGLDGKHLYAHRFMCELKHGAAPTLDHEAAHSCGNGHGGCCNPNHLSWNDLGKQYGQAPSRHLAQAHMEQEKL